MHIYPDKHHDPLFLRIEVIFLAGQERNSINEDDIYTKIDTHSRLIYGYVCYLIRYVTCPRHIKTKVVDPAAAGSLQDHHYAA